MSTIVLKTIEMTLDPKSIDRAIKDVEQLQNGLAKALQQLCEYLAEWGVHVAQANLVQLGAVGHTQQLFSSIRAEKENGAWFVRAGDDDELKYATYVEFGTGIAGANDAHPVFKEQDRQSREQAKLGRIMNIKIRRYDLNKHGDKGWVYKGDDGKFHTTTGMPPRPFMYNTYKELMREAELNGGRLIAQFIP